MPGVGGMAQPGMDRSAGLSGYRKNKMAPKPKKAPRKASMMYEERKASMQPPKSRKVAPSKVAPRKRTSVSMKQPKFK